jgi:tripartite-type tricarboxylate transporter receptor subunit TctC
MKLSNFAGAVACLLTLFGSAAASAQDSAASYPSQSVRIIVPFSAGSLTDLLARILSDRLGPLWQQSVVVENHPGIAGTAIAARAPADGYTLLLISNGHAIIGIVNEDLPFDPVKDFAGVSKLASMPLIMIAPPNADYHSLQGLIDRARAHPGLLTYSSAGLNSTAFIAGELFKQTEKLDILHVPYKGTPDAQTSIMRGDTAFFFSPAAVSDALITTGKVTGLAVTSATRVATLPNVPTFREAGHAEYEYDAWFGLLAPANTPKEILAKLSHDIGTVMNMPDVRDKLAIQGVTAVSSSPTDFGALLAADTARYSGMLKKNSD